MGYQVKLVLENGKVFEGLSLASQDIVTGPVIISRLQSSYLETMTDPANLGTIVVSASPLLGNYGVNDEDFESDNITVKALVCHDYCETPANFRSQESLSEFFNEKNKALITGIETRNLAQSLREDGEMLGTIVPLDYPAEKIKESFKNYKRQYQEITTKPLVVKTKNPKYQVLAIDYGIRNSLIALLKEIGCNITVVRPDIKKSDLVKYQFDALVLTSGVNEINESYLNNLKEFIDDYPILAEGIGAFYYLKAKGISVKRLNTTLIIDNHGIKDLERNKIFFPSFNLAYKAVKAPKKLISHFDEINEEAVGFKDEKAQVVFFELNNEPESQKLVKDFLKKGESVCR
ncbi:MAG: hypothetical protein FWE36_05575 [Erysipelotrichales bacterium]|nr:hypothetical protein [Erysipelotrichales bacterium]